jgi:hypothetical protein
MLGKKAKIGTGFVDIISTSKSKVSNKRNTSDEGSLELQNEDIAEQNIETNQEYMDVMFNTYEGEMYGTTRNSREREKSRQQSRRHIRPNDRREERTQDRAQDSVQERRDINQESRREPKDDISKISEKTPNLPVLPKKTSMRLNEQPGSRMSDIHQRMKARKLIISETKQEIKSDMKVSDKIGLDENMDVLKNL